MDLRTPDLAFETLDEASDPAEILPIFNSNPDWVAASNDFAGKTSWNHSDAEMHLWKESRREDSVAFGLRSLQTDELIGLGGLLLPHPTRLQPMVGLLLIHREWQERGLGTQTATALADWLTEAGWQQILATVLKACPGVLRFWNSRGYEIVECAKDQDKRPVWVLGRELTRPPGTGDPLDRGASG